MKVCTDTVNFIYCVNVPAPPKTRSKGVWDCLKGLFGIQDVWETKYRIRFKTVWNGCCIPFHKKICNFFMKRNTESVSKLYETDSVFRFIKKFANCCNSVIFLVVVSIQVSPSLNFFFFCLLLIWNVYKKIFYETETTFTKRNTFK